LNQHTAPIEKLEGNEMAKHAATGEWITNGAIQHKDGIPFYRAMAPFRLHFCKAQTRGRIFGVFIERCACGATRRDGTFWFERNKDRRSPSHAGRHIKK
jgi:hypothetical protein